MFTNLLKGMIKKRDEQLDEDMHRWGLGGFWAQKLMYSDSCGVSLSYADVLVYLEVLWCSCYWHFTEASSHKHDQSSTPFPGPIPFLEDVRWGWKFRASSYGLVFLVTCPHPGAILEPTQSHLSRTMLLVSYHSGVYKGFRSAALRMGLKTNIWTRDIPWHLSLKNL